MLIKTDKQWKIHHINCNGFKWCGQEVGRLKQNN